MENGVSLLADPRYIRSWPGGCGDRKVGSNYGPTIKMLKKALKKGYQQVLWLYGEHNEITEVGAMNIFMVYLNDDGGTNQVLFKNKFILSYFFIYPFFYIVVLQQYPILQ